MKKAMFRSWPTAVLLETTVSFLFLRSLPFHKRNQVSARRTCIGEDVARRPTSPAIAPTHGLRVGDASVLADDAAWEVGCLTDRHVHSALLFVGIWRH